MRKIAIKEAGIPETFKEVEKEINLLNSTVGVIEAKLSKRFFGGPTKDLKKVRDALYDLNFAIISMDQTER